MNKTLNRRQTLGMMAGVAGGAFIKRAFATSSLRGNPVPAEDISGLKAAVTGTVVTKDSADFDSARDALVWNKRVSRISSPEAIVRAGSVQDVAVAIKFARARGLKVAIRSGGHNYNGTALQNDSVCIDLSKLNTTSINPLNRKAIIGPAVKGGAFASALAKHGLAFPVGHCSDVGLGGYLLNGGFGWNFGEWGPACMSVTGIEVVTASGEVIYSEEKNNSDFLWAARGAGPAFFGVVTRFEVDLHPLRPVIQMYSVNFPIESARVVGKWLAEKLPHVDPTVEVICSLAPIDATGRPVISVSAFAFGTSKDQALRKFAALQALPVGASIIGQTIVQTATFEELLGGTDAGFPNGKRMAGEPIWSETSVERLLVALQRFAQNGPPAPSAIVIVTLGGHGNRPHLRPSPHRAALSRSGTLVGAYAFWDDAAKDQENMKWVRSVVDAVEPYRSGRYIGEVDLSRGIDHIRECFTPEAWNRLVELKKRYDPANLFNSYLAAE